METIYMLPEILDKVSKEKSFNKRVELLKEYESEPLKHVIRGALDPRIKWLVPNTRPPFELNEAPDYEFTGNSLYRETKQFSYFISYNGTIPPKANNLRQVKRETIFIQLLESLYKDEVELLLSIINKKLPYPNMTKKLFNTAFPGLLPEGKKNEQEE